MLLWSYKARYYHHANDGTRYTGSIMYYIYLLCYTYESSIACTAIPGTLCTIYTYYIISVSFALCAMLKYGIYVYRVLLCSTCPYPIPGNMVYLAC